MKYEEDGVFQTTEYSEDAEKRGVLNRMSEGTEWGKLQAPTSKLQRNFKFQ
jgi:hypothetical protein